MQPFMGASPGDSAASPTTGKGVSSPVTDLSRLAPSTSGLLTQGSTVSCMEQRSRPQLCAPKEHTWDREASFDELLRAVLVDSRVTLRLLFSTGLRRARPVGDTSAFSALQMRCSTTKGSWQGLVSRASA